MADLRARRVEVGHAHALVVGRDLERAARAGRGLLEDEAEVLAAQPRHLGAGVLGALEVPGQVEKEADLLPGEVGHLEDAAVAKVERHGRYLLLIRA